VPWPEPAAEKFGGQNDAVADARTVGGEDVFGSGGHVSTPNRCRSRAVFVDDDADQGVVVAGTEVGLGDPA